MEDAVKALLIAAGVMIGVMIISLGVTLFSSLSQYTDNAQVQIEENALQKFNEQYTKYINCADTPATAPLEFTLTIHDVVTVANMAYENNKKYGLDSADENNYYVTVKIGSAGAELQKDINTKASELLKLYIDKTYKCTYSNVRTNPNTGRVCEVIFQEL